MANSNPRRLASAAILASLIILRPAPARTRVPSTDWGLANSAKYSAGPPMPNEVREASGSPRRTPGSSRSHARLDSLRQLIAQLSDVTRAHQEENVVGADQAFEGFASPLK